MLVQRAVFVMWEAGNIWISTIRKDIDIENKVLDVLTKTDITINQLNVEACHWLDSWKSNQKVILKLSRQKGHENIRRSRK